MLNFIRNRDIFGYRIAGYHQDGNPKFLTVIGGMFSIGLKVFYLLVTL